MLNKEQEDKNQEEIEIKKLDIKCEEKWAWKLVKVRTGKEFFIQSELEKDTDAFAATCVPFIIAPIQRGSKVVIDRKPLHGGYIYVLCKEFGYQESMRLISKRFEIAVYIVNNNPVNLEQVRFMYQSAKKMISHNLFNAGDEVIITAGIWKDMIGTVAKVDNLTVMINLFDINKTIQVSINDVKSYKI